MKPENLIRLGALAQQMFKMKNDFKIMKCPADAGNTVSIPIYHAYTVITEYDSVVLVEIGSASGGEGAAIGYSAKGNALVVKFLG